MVASCELAVPQAPEDSSILDGPIDGLSPAELRVHLAGDAAFNNEVFVPASGLGPVFVAASCGTCHPADGRGHPSSKLIRFGQDAPGTNPWVGRGGPQLQQHAIPGFSAEVLPPGVASSVFLAPIATGLGYLDAVSDETIMQWADPDDADGDGVSGVPHWLHLPDYVPMRPGTIVNTDGHRIGRFGRKAAAGDLLHQTAGAYNQDIGITSVFEPVDAHSNAVIDPEVATQTVNDVVFYLKTLKAPPRRNADDATVMRGEQVFTSIGCASCHRPSMTTGPSPLPYLANKTIAPYTDMLLHDMGPELDDGYTEGNAQTAEWRTTPLWGLGLSADAQGGALFLLHDGRATSIKDAIELHGGEGSASRTKYRVLSSEDQRALEQFLMSL